MGIPCADHYQKRSQGRGVRVGGSSVSVNHVKTQVQAERTGSGTRRVQGFEKMTRKQTRTPRAELMRGMAVREIININNSIAWRARDAAAPPETRSAKRHSSSRRLNFTGVVNNRRNSNNNRNASNESNNNTRNVVTWYGENMYPGTRGNIPKSKRRFVSQRPSNSPTRRVKTVYHRDALARTSS